MPPLAVSAGSVKQDGSLPDQTFERIITQLCDKHMALREEISSVLDEVFVVSIVMKSRNLIFCQF